MSAIFVLKLVTTVHITFVVL